METLYGNRPVKLAEESQGAIRLLTEASKHHEGIGQEEGPSETR